MPEKMPLLFKMVLALLAAALLYAAGRMLQHTLSIMIFSFVLAYLLDPLVVLLERARVRRIYGILALYAVLGLFSIFCLTYLIPFINLRWIALLHDLPLYAQKLKLMASHWKERFTSPYVAEEWSWLFTTLQGNIDAVMTKLGAGVYMAAGKVVFNLFNLLLSPILVFFMLFYKQEIKEGLASWLPAEKRELILAICRDFNVSVGGFIRGQIVVSAIVSVLSAGALIALGVNHPLFCAIFAGAASVIPFIGVLLSTILPVFFAYAEYQSGVVVLKVVAAFSVIYFLEGYLVKPIVFKESLDLNPLTTIVMVMALGELMGFWGVLLAIPLAASLGIIRSHLRGGEAAPGQ